MIVNAIINQWVETNQSNFSIYPTDIRLSWYYANGVDTDVADVDTDVCGG